MSWHNRRVRGTSKKKNVAKKVTIDGIKFDSRLEGRRYEELKRRQAAGLIKGLETHPGYPLVIDGRPVMIRSPKMPNGRKGKYSADFRYTDVETGLEVIEDTKGFDRPIDRLRRSVAECIYQIRVEVVTRSRA